ncbi:MAG: PIG-L family deacetylase [Deltaproteobacteria bacterium]|nr:PIG-L family deacetylase [Deltaproteobacteria bacterium]
MHIGFPGPRASLSIAVFLAFLAHVPALATVVVLAPHPDDAEASCGGLIANTAAAGEEVVIVAMTGGELGVPGKGMAEARAIRVEEARKAAAVLGAKVESFGAIDGSLAVDSASTGKLTEILVRLAPSVVLAPWPLDVHADHQASGLLAWRAFQDGRFLFDLYFYETCNSPHTKSFQFVPTDYVDVSAVLKKKQEATFQHQSQGPADWLEQYTALARVRGFESDVPFAEGYIRARNSSGLGGRAGVVGKTLPKPR